MVSKKLSKEDLEFLVSLLNLTDREEFFEEFKEEYKGKLSRSAIYKLSRGIIHLSDENIISVVLNNERAQRWLLERARKKYERLEKILEEE